MLKNLRDVPIRILVTGTRGKSSLVRLLHSALCACGIETRSRITGVLPRELGCRGSRVIVRNAPTHIQEMRWWLEQIPPDARAVVAENSAVAPELQPVAAKFLAPTLVILTNCRPDHEEVWGMGVECAKNALLQGIPQKTPVVLGHDTLDAKQILENLGNPCHYVAQTESKNENLDIAMTACSLLNLPAEKAKNAMTNLEPDIADFRIIKINDCELAFAFSANETASTEKLFNSTGWKAEETILLFHHRPDRPARLSSFKSWIESKNWAEVIFTRQYKTFFSFDKIKWNDDINSAASFKNRCGGVRKIFGCGNVAGYPLEIAGDAQ